MTLRSAVARPLRASSRPVDAVASGAVCLSVHRGTVRAVVLHVPRDDPASQPPEATTDGPGRRAPTPKQRETRKAFGEYWAKINREAARRIREGEA